MISGGTPSAEKLTIRPIIVAPSFLATSRLASMTQAAPSVIWLELPAVEEPPFLKAGFSLPRDSTVVWGRMPSSLSTRTSCISPSLSLTVVVYGVISDWSHPALSAAVALAWLVTANASWVSLVTPNFSATFSLVTPMGMRQLRALLTRTRHQRGSWHRRH